MTDRATETVRIAAEEAGERLDRVLAARIPALSRSRLKALILAGQVTIGGAHDPRSAATGQRRRHHHACRCRRPNPRSRRARPSRSTIVYEDDAMIVIDKPAAWWCIRPPAMPAARWSMR